ncbi:rho GTPase-activating protein 21-like isoform X3 [Myxocyprinus asiaticus]|uniref:rho GTPase-activating protein 21-like isoform X3 n=1 Tax=Myxocyprinus asiaticus TaxID=70543 RepID=UPI0022236E49|nr:rho GTPase-activating protein 21-like isoform X3 [Myxocyprinus asiaticus]
MSSWSAMGVHSNTSALYSQQNVADQDDSSGVLFKPEEEQFSWPGPKTLRLQRTSQGFGFTLRHFIVYPPESAMHSSFKEEDHGHRGRPRNRLEPMDTIFVKQVKEGAPAHSAGLCTGDRIVKVNGESIIGKTYSQVIELIQNSHTFLELCVMPKDEDILQLAYSQDAYLKGHDAYSGNARHIPEPPPICYTRVDCKPPGMAQATETSVPGDVLSDLGYRVEIPVPPSPPPPIPKTQTVVCVCNESVRTVVVPPDVHMGRMGPSHRGDYGLTGQDPIMIRARPGTVSGGRPPYLHPGKADVFPSGYHGEPYAVPPTHYSPAASITFPSTHQNIDWRTYQTYREYIDNKGLHTCSRTIQERLDSLRAASQNVHSVPHCGPQPGPQPGWGKKLNRRSSSHDRAYQGPSVLSPRSTSQDRMSGAERAGHARDWPPRSLSSDGLMRKSHVHSSDYVEHGELVSGAPWAALDRQLYGRVDQRSRPSRQSLPPRAVLYHRPTGYGMSVRGVAGSQPHSSRTDIPPTFFPERSRNGVNQAKVPLSKDQSGTVVGNHISNSASVQSRTRAETMQSPETGKETAVGHRSSSCSAPPSQKPQGGSSAQRTHQWDLKLQSVNGSSPMEGVVFREKPPTGKGTPQPLRHPSYILAVNDTDGPEPAVGDVCWLPNDARREMHMRRLGERLDSSFCSSNLDESLDSIPFIDEPASPSIDHDGNHIPASVVISGAQAIISDSPSPTTPSPLMRRQLSHDQESLRNAILESQTGTKTERSKSYDEGLDNYREEGRGRSSKPSLRVFRKALDGNKSDDSSSRRDSSTEIFNDSTKEGWLHFRQLNTEKSKRVGGGMRPWKQMYAVLRGHSLYLYKDKKEGLAHVNFQLEDEPQAISIKACLIDISYSDTKRKNVLRLTTSDCEYLFQAEGREDMLSWIRVIQENSNLDDENATITSTDLINRKLKEYISMSNVCCHSAPSSKTEPSPKTSRQSLSIRHTLLGGSSKSQSPHSPRNEQERSKDDSSGAAWRRGIPGLKKKPQDKRPTAGVTFGLRLDNCPPAQNNRFVPLIVEVCCKLVEEKGLEYTGIYRVPGNNAAISSMQEELDTKGMTDIDIQDDKWRDLNVISSLLKSFFRKLPEPLFTNEKYSNFIDANRTEDPIERLKALKRLIHELPDHHYETLKYLSGHLKTVSENCEKNKMEPRNLAIVFGPTLVRTSEDNMTHMVTHMPDQYKIVETLIQQYDWFFTDDGDEEPTTTVEQESTVQSQPVPNIDHLLTNIGRTATLPGDVSDSTTSDSAKSKQGSWGSGKDQYSRELLRSSIFASRKRKKPKDKPQPSSSDDDLDASFSKKDLPVQNDPNWPADDQTEEAENKVKLGDQIERTEDGDQSLGESLDLASNNKQLHSEHLPQQTSPSPKIITPPKTSYHMQMTRQSSLSDPPSNYDDGCASDLGTLNSTSSQASVPRMRHRRIPGHWMENTGIGPGAEVCSITSDYSTTSSMTFHTGLESVTFCPEVQSVTESRGDDADDERSELISEGRPMETDSESDLSVFAGGQEGGLTEPEGNVTPLQYVPNLIPSHRIIACDTLARKRGSRKKTDSESSADGSRSDKESSQLSRVLEAVKERSTGSLSSSSRSESERATEPLWRIKITDRLKCRLRTSADDMFGVGSQRTRSPETRSKRKSNIRRRHTMGGQRDFAELSVIGDWQRVEGTELSAVDRLKPKCSSQDFSIRDWIARERHRASNPEVSLDMLDLHPSRSRDLLSAGPSHSYPGQLLNGDVAAAQSKSLNLASHAHPHKLSGAQVVRSRFYQYL